MKIENDDGEYGDDQYLDGEYGDGEYGWWIRPVKLKKTYKNIL